ncbi:hypothetical protein ACFOQM_06290 [Paenibacillus sp. GCM10012307]|uniref:Uncharacterized protein n=1 Tax=Paenibacillus roseus TaxID=2798579 RepID=A0A934MPI3_9BACL|nr:hypothetical protein [Paenibacillus roseus]MBJ6360908.1 hypothetical protein [Paenibacillus roseus]
MKMMVKAKLTRPPGDKYIGIINDWNIEDKTSQKGLQYQALLLSITIPVNGELMNVTQTVPLFWNPGDPMYVLCNTFGALPRFNEDFDCEFFIGKQVLVTIKENTYQNRTYSNVVQLVPSSEELPKELLAWKKQRESSVSASQSIFDDEEEEETTNISPNDLERTKQTEAAEDINNKPHQPTNPLRKNRISPAKSPQKKVWGSM